jgi:hypothetical protein
MDGAGLAGQGVLLAQRAFKWQFFWATLALVAALLAGAAIIAMLERWRKRSKADRLSAGDQLSHFREPYQQGTLSKDEFDQIRARLAGEVRQELNLGPPPQPAPPAANGTVPREMTLPEPPADDSKPS